MYVQDDVWFGTPEMDGHQHLIYQARDNSRLSSNTPQSQTIYT